MRTKQVTRKGDRKLPTAPYSKQASPHRSAHPLCSGSFANLRVVAVALSSLSLLLHAKTLAAQLTIGIPQFAVRTNSCWAVNRSAPSPEENRTRKPQLLDIINIGPMVTRVVMMSWVVTMALVLPPANGPLLRNPVNAIKSLRFCAVVPPGITHKNDIASG